MMRILTVKRGVSRAVFLIGAYAIKFPRVSSDGIFILGLLGNTLERDRYKQSNKKLNLKHYRLGKVLFCFPFGLFLVMRRYKPLNRILSNTELKQMPFKNIDNNGHNAGVDEFGRVVIIDYGNIDMYLEVT